MDLRANDLKSIAAIRIVITRTMATDSASGSMAPIDAALGRKFGGDFGLGASAFRPVAEDTGDIADRREGWVPEYGVKSGLEGNAVYFDDAGAS